MTTAGVYIAWGPWLGRDHYKVGHTGSLETRLSDSAYVTCFPRGHWRYVATFETQTKSAAQTLEAAVLFCSLARREGTSELVRASAAELFALVESVAACFGIAVSRRDAPVYEAPSKPPATNATVEQRLAKKRERLQALMLHPASNLSTADSSSSTADCNSSTAASNLSTADSSLSTADSSSSTADSSSSTADCNSAAAECNSATAECNLTDSNSSTADSNSATAKVAGCELTKVAGCALTKMTTDETELADALQDALELEYDLGAPIELRDYQLEAKAAVLDELRRTERAVLQMACRTGKTAVAYEVAQEFLPAGRVLFLVPGLSLLRQTAQKLVAYGCEPPLLVGSDPRPVPVATDGPLLMTTDPERIAASAARVVVATYQSSALTLGLEFALRVFDECHRVCGSAGARPFSAVHLADAPGRRLYMTATPAYEPAAVTMKDRAAFGGIAHRYHLRQGIDAGYVNDFRLEIISAANMAEAVAAAAAGIEKMLVYCRSIDHALELAAAVRLPRHEVLVAHSRDAAGAAAAAKRLATPGVAAVLFNCRLFVEGVEIPTLNAVFFAAPRSSPRDIVQCVCRPLNRAQGKPPSAVFIPVLDETPNARRYAHVVPFVDALLSEDPALYEHLLDPKARPYALRASLARNGLALPSDAVLAEVRRVSRGNGRLTKPAMIPWERSYAELRRVVLECGRYPKTTDAWVVGDATVNLHGVYRALVRDYEAGALEPWQAKALAALPCWDTYGVGGPYLWPECMAFLERWLAEHDGVPPMLEIHRGGYVGLEASPIERLSGALTCINQQDAAEWFQVSAQRCADLERICAPYNLRWRKERDAAGRVVEGGPPTFIQDAYARFKAYYKEHGAGGEYIATWFEGYPLKHSKQQRLDLIGSAALPPRWKATRRETAAAQC
jgi:superfamily II DNA or RNA helicase